MLDTTDPTLNTDDITNNSDAEFIVSVIKFNNKHKLLSSWERNNILPTPNKFDYDYDPSNPYNWFLIKI